MALDFGSLKSAIDQLATYIGYAKSKMAQADQKLFEQFRNSTVQCFEFTFELAWKSIKRKIELDHPSPTEVDQWDFKQLIREAAIRGLIESPEGWFEFRRMRNLSSHTYDQSKADQVYACADAFHGEASFLLKKLVDEKK